MNAPSHMANLEATKEGEKILHVAVAKKKGKNEILGTQCANFQKITK